MESEDLDEEDSEDNNDEDKEDKKKNKTVNFGKIATAVGRMQAENIKVTPPDINKSDYTFSPDAENNIIRYGLKGIVKIGRDLIISIIENRPYDSVQDFLNKVKINKTQMINLIKSGAFDSFGERQKIMNDYIYSIADVKTKLNLQNMKMLIDKELIPDELSFEVKVYNFNKYIKKFKRSNLYDLDNIALNFLDRYFSFNLITTNESESGFAVDQKSWDKTYKISMDSVRNWIKENQTELLEKINKDSINQIKDKYAKGNDSKWEMDSISYYYHNHELENVDYNIEGLINFFDLPNEPIIERYFNIKGKQVPIFKIYRIAGTVLDKDKNKKSISLLTREGVVNVKIFGDVFNNYNRQISEKGLDGKKKIIEKSWFTRGNKIIVTGIRRDDGFIGKKYKSTPHHLIELIEDVDDYGNIKIKKERDKVDE